MIHKHIVIYVDKLRSGTATKTTNKNGLLSQAWGVVG